MTYDLIETSFSQGAPIELYEFARDAEVWRYTSADANTTVSGILYESVPIRRSTIEQSQDVGKNPVTITASISVDFVTQYIASPPANVVNLTIRRFHSTDSNSEVVTIWTGRVLNLRFSENEVEITCEPIFTSIRRSALRRNYSTNCPHVLYGNQCRASRALFTVTGNVTSLSGNDLTIPVAGQQTDGYYTGGVVEWTDTNSVRNLRFINTQVGSTVNITLPFFGLTAGQEVRVIAGCDRSISTCVNKFNNEENYGGFPYIPDKNPFSSSSPVF